MRIRTFALLVLGITRAICPGYAQHKPHQKPQRKQMEYGLQWVCEGLVCIWHVKRDFPDHAFREKSETLA